MYLRSLLLQDPVQCDPCKVAFASNDIRDTLNSTRSCQQQDHRSREDSCVTRLAVELRTRAKQGAKGLMVVPGLQKLSSIFELGGTHRYVVFTSRLEIENMRQGGHVQGYKSHRKVRRRCKIVSE